MRAVNLLPPDLRSASSKAKATAPAREPGEGIGAFVLLGALALCVVAVAGYVLSNNVIKERQARLGEVTAQSQATVKRAADLKPYADFQALTEARMGTVQGLANSRFDWEQALRDLSRAMPSDVHLSGLNGSVGGAAAGGSGIRGAINAPAIELKGCTRSQPAVARLMSRLRNIDGVTRVSLSKSDKETAVAPAVAPSTGGQPTEGGSTCGKGAPPAFELVVFFEGAALQTALATAPTDKPTAPTPAASPAPAATPSSTTQGGTTP
ncbi:MAG TPA: PilN domain-containing protein [Solirubrobacteraceae bacterium]|nr:PilN domain-containing protein [Solirubrobacteraceae bacterium]